VSTPSYDPAQPGDPLDLRCSDVDREAIADRLRDAYAQGRIDREELDERVAVTYAARTYRDLVPIVLDLPGNGLAVPDLAAALAVPRPGAMMPAPAPGDLVAGRVAAPGTVVPDATPLVAIFSGAERKGPWVVGERTLAVALFGGVEIDLTSAVLVAGDVEITAVALFGGVEITVPRDVRVVLGGFAIFGGRSGPDENPMSPNAPVLRVNGWAAFGGIDVKRPKIKRKRRGEIDPPPFPPQLPAA
jgi:hypothetical protein